LQITARVDYALRALVTLAAREPAVVSGHTLADTQALPTSFLQSILADLRRAHLIRGQRGGAGGTSGYTLARPATQITVADVVTAIDGALLGVRGVPVERTEYHDAAAELHTVWMAAEAAMRQVLDRVTLADVVTAQLPDAVRNLALPA
jgi:Rrf2 family protein